MLRRWFKLLVCNDDIAARFDARLLALRFTSSLHDFAAEVIPPPNTKAGYRCFYRYYICAFISFLLVTHGTRNGPAQYWYHQVIVSSYVIRQIPVAVVLMPRIRHSRDLDTDDELFTINEDID